MHFIVKTTRFIENIIKFITNKIFTKVFIYNELQKKPEITNSFVRQIVINIEKSTKKS